MGFKIKKPKIKIKMPRVTSIFGGLPGIAASALGLDQITENLRLFSNPTVGSVGLASEVARGIGVKGDLPTFGNMAQALNTVDNVLRPPNPFQNFAEGPGPNTDMPPSPDRGQIAEGVNNQMGEDARRRRASRTLFTSSAGLLGNRARTTSASSTLLGM